MMPVGPTILFFPNTSRALSFSTSTYLFSSSQTLLFFILFFSFFFLEDCPCPSLYLFSISWWGRWIGCGGARLRIRLDPVLGIVLTVLLLVKVLIGNGVVFVLVLVFLLQPPVDLRFSPPLPPFSPPIATSLAKKKKKRTLVLFGGCWVRELQSEALMAETGRERRGAGVWRHPSVNLKKKINKCICVIKKKKS